MPPLYQQGGPSTTTNSEHEMNNQKERNNRRSMFNKDDMFYREERDNHQTDHNELNRALSVNQFAPMFFTGAANNNISNNNQVPYESVWIEQSKM